MNVPSDSVMTGSDVETLVPVKRERIIRVIYWDCGNPSHHHTTELIAWKCMVKNAKRVPATPEGVRRRRSIAATRAVLNGATFNEAAKQSGVGAASCREVVRRTLRKCRDGRLFPEGVPEDIDWFSLAGWRADASFWLHRLDVLEREWGIGDDTK